MAKILNAISSMFPSVWDQSNLLGNSLPQGGMYTGTSTAIPPTLNAGQYCRDPARMGWIDTNTGQFYPDNGITVGGFNVAAAPIFDDTWRQRAIKVRLHVSDNAKLAYEHMSTAFSEKANKVFVFVVQDGQPVTIEDDARIFPSDQLLASLRLLEK